MLHVVDRLYCSWLTVILAVSVASCGETRPRAPFSKKKNDHKSSQSTKLTNGEKFKFNLAQVRAAQKNLEKHGYDDVRWSFNYGILFTNKLVLSDVSFSELEDQLSKEEYEYNMFGVVQVRAISGSELLVTNSKEDLQTYHQDGDSVIWDKRCANVKNSLLDGAQKLAVCDLATVKKTAQVLTYFVHCNYQNFLVYDSLNLLSSPEQAACDRDQPREFADEKNQIPAAAKHEEPLAGASLRLLVSEHGGVDMVTELKNSTFAAGNSCSKAVVQLKTNGDKPTFVLERNTSKTDSSSSSQTWRLNDRSGADAVLKSSIQYFEQLVRDARDLDVYFVCEWLHLDDEKIINL